LDENTQNSPSSIWTQNRTTVTNGNITLNVGDYVNYDSNGEVNYSGYFSGETKIGNYEDDLNGKWRVLGVENGQILLMSTIDVDLVYIETPVDYSDVGIEKINAACEEFNQGEGAAKGINSRSIKVEDIDRITGFDKTTYEEGTIKQYGNKVNYSFSSRTEWSLIYNYTVEGKSELNGSLELYNGGIMRPFGGTDLKDGETYEAEENNYYSYKGETYFPNTINDSVYAMLFRNNTNTSDASYWLNEWAYCSHDSGWDSGMFCVKSGGVSMDAKWDCFYGGEPYGEMGVRAVVTLETDVKLTANGANSWTLSK